MSDAKTKRYESGTMVRVQIREWTWEEFVDAWQSAGLGDEPPAWLGNYPEAFNAIVDMEDWARRKKAA